MHVAFILYSNITRCGAISGAASGASYFTSLRNIIVYASCNNINASFFTIFIPNVTNFGQFIARQVILRNAKEMT